MFGFNEEFCSTLKTPGGNASRGKEEGWATEERGWDDSMKKSHLSNRNSKKTIL